MAFFQSSSHYPQRTAYVPRPATRRAFYDYPREDELYFSYQQEQMHREQEREYRAHQLAELAYQRELEAAELRRQLESQRQRQRQAEYREQHRRMNAHMAARRYEEQAAHAAESARRRAQSKRRPVPMSDFMFPQMFTNRFPFQEKSTKATRNPAQDISSQPENERRTEQGPVSERPVVVPDVTTNSPAKSPSPKSETSIANSEQSLQAATIIQNAYRKHRSAKALEALAKTFQDIFGGAQFAEAHQAVVVLSSITDKYEPQLNKALAATEESFTRLLVQLDAIPSYGDRRVKNQRKGLVTRIQAVLNDLDVRKKTAVRKSDIITPEAKPVKVKVKPIVQVPITQSATATLVAPQREEVNLPDFRDPQMAAADQDVLVKPCSSNQEEQVVDEWQPPFADSDELPTDYLVPAATLDHAELSDSDSNATPRRRSLKRGHDKRRLNPADKAASKPSRKSRKTRNHHKRSPGLRKAHAKPEALHWFADMVSEALTSHQSEAAARASRKLRTHTHNKHVATAC